MSQEKEIMLKDMNFCYLLEFGEKYGKKFMDSATKTWIDAAKAAFKRVAQKNAEATGDLIGNKIVDKITSVGETKSDEKEDGTNQIEEINIPAKKGSKLLML